MQRYSLLLTGLLISLPFANSLLRPAIAQTLSANFSQNEEAQRTEVEGSWLLKISQIQNPSVSWTAISSFAAGGVWLATGSKDRLNPASPLYGTWKCIGHHRFNSTTYFFIFDPKHPDAEAIATLKADQVFQLEGLNTLIGAGKTSICDLAGQNCNILPETIEVKGTRIVPEDPTELIQLLPVK